MMTIVLCHFGEVNKKGSFMKHVSIFILIAALCAAPGCGNKTGSDAPVTTVPTTTTINTDPNAARNASIIRIATAQAVQLGLNVYSNEGHKTEALLIAEKIKTLIGSGALPWLNGNSGASSAAVNTFMNGQFVTLPSEAQDLISLAASLLDSYLPAPSANAVLDSNQLLYVQAFFNGLTEGATQFAGDPPAAPAVPKARSIRARSTAAWFNTQK